LDKIQKTLEQAHAQEHDAKLSSEALLSEAQLKAAEIVHNAQSEMEAQRKEASDAVQDLLEKANTTYLEAQTHSNEIVAESDRKREENEAIIQRLLTEANERADSMVKRSKAVIHDNETRFESAFESSKHRANETITHLTNQINDIFARITELQTVLSVPIELLPSNFDSDTESDSADERRASDENYPENLATPDDFETIAPERNS
jgi:F0F1-type ATP synthase membrane subunit b/b'